MPRPSVQLTPADALQQLTTQRLKNATRQKKYYETHKDDVLQRRAEKYAAARLARLATAVVAE